VLAILLLRQDFGACETGLWCCYYKLRVLAQDNKGAVPDAEKGVLQYRQILAHPCLSRALPWLVGNDYQSCCWRLVRDKLGEICQLRNYKTPEGHLQPRPRQCLDKRYSALRSVDVQSIALSPLTGCCQAVGDALLEAAANGEQAFSITTKVLQAFLPNPPSITVASNELMNVLRNNGSFDIIFNDKAGIGSAFTEHGDVLLCASKKHFTAMAIESFRGCHPGRRYSLVQFPEHESPISNLLACTTEHFDTLFKKVTESQNAYKEFFDKGSLATLRVVVSRKDVGNVITRMLTTRALSLIEMSKKAREKVVGMEENKIEPMNIQASTAASPKEKVIEKKNEEKFQREWTRSDLPRRQNQG